MKSGPSLLGGGRYQYPRHLKPSNVMTWYDDGASGAGAPKATARSIIANKLFFDNWYDAQRLARRGSSTSEIFRSSGIKQPPRVKAESWREIPSPSDDGAIHNLCRRPSAREPSMRITSAVKRQRKACAWLISNIAAPATSRRN